MNLVYFLLFFCSVLLNCFSFAGEEKRNKITVYTHELYVQDWMHVGNPVKKAFEYECKCKVEFVTFTNSSSILSRLILEGNNTRADVVLGLSSYILDKAEDTKLFDKLNFKPDNLTLPIKWTNEYFIPFEYSYLTLVYNSKKLKYPSPVSFDDLVNSKYNYKIIIQDPRTSSTGVAFVLWLKEIYGDKSNEVWKKLKKKVHLISRTWGESYSLFTYGQGDFVVTNSTSPIYHMLVENNHDYKSVSFDEGHILEVSTLAKLKTSKNKELADKFIEYVLSKPFQRLIPINHFMHSVVDIGPDLPKEYSQIPNFKGAFFVDSNDLRNNRDKWIKEWLLAMLSEK